MVIIPARVIFSKTLPPPLQRCHSTSRRWRHVVLQPKKKKKTSVDWSHFHTAFMSKWHIRQNSLSVDIVAWYVQIFTHVHACTLQRWREVELLQLLTLISETAKCTRRLPSRSSVIDEQTCWGKAKTFIGTPPFYGRSQVEHSRLLRGPLILMNNQCHLTQFFMFRVKYLVSSRCVWVLQNVSSQIN